ncbi:MAG: Gfo/Idh/MocA family oxidoreductase [Lentisphaeria bacterium]|nr:Gfo/Idh/MocA family oxidoreductase [Lentisphaeria bacterium]NQZ70366.1 Gfo/Idh/MocA family oxidoreductase [Lentisphaeria bacterium]
MSDKIKWGILAAGNIARKFAGDLEHAKKGEFYAIGSRSLEKAEQFCTDFNGTKAYGSYDELLADPDVDAIYISLPNHMHLEWTTRCAEAGKAILCEKPLTSNAAEAVKLFEACKANNAFMLEAFMYRCHPQTAKLKELLRNSVIGDVRMIQAHFSYNMGLDLDNIRLRNDAAGGAIMDVGCYCVSMTRLVAGAALGLDHPAEPIEFHGVAHIGDESRVDEYATAVLKFDGNILANLTTGSQVSVDGALRIWGTDGHIIVPNPWFPGNECIIEVHRNNEDVEEVKITIDLPLYAIEADIVADEMHGLEASPMTWNDSLGNMKTLDAWRQSVGLVFDLEK